MEYAIDRILDSMTDNINDFIKDEEYDAFYYIFNLIESEAKNINDKLELIKKVSDTEVREMLYEHYISRLSQDLFYERSKVL